MYVNEGIVKVWGGVGADLKKALDIHVWECGVRSAHLARCLLGSLRAHELTVVRCPLQHWRALKAGNMNISFQLLNKVLVLLLLFLSLFIIGTKIHGCRGPAKIHNNYISLEFKNEFTLLRALNAGIFPMFCIDMGSMLPCLQAGLSFIFVFFQ